MEANSVNNDPLYQSERQEITSESQQSKINPAMLSFTKTDPSKDFPLKKAIQDKPESYSQLGKIFAKIFAFVCFVLILIAIIANAR